MAPDPVAAWHRIVLERDAAALAALLAEDAVFHSPVVHTPQRGRARVMAYLGAALHLLGSQPGFRYVREIRGENDAMLEFELEIDDVLVDGVDILRWNEQGQIVDFKVLIRPLKAINLVQERMAALLAAAAPK